MTTPQATAATINALAAAIGEHKGSLARWVRERWFPKRGPRGWLVEDVRQALRLRVNRRGPRAAGLKAAGSPPLAASAPPLAPVRSAAPAGDAGGGVLADSAAPALDKAKAAVALASRLLAEADNRGEAGPREVGALARALEELRRGESAALDLAKRRGELVERTAAAAVAARIAQLLVELLATVEARAGSQLCIWLADKELAAAGAEAQARTARQWFGDQARALRELGVARIEGMLVEETP